MSQFEGSVEFNSDDENLDFLMDSPPSSKHESDDEKKEEAVGGNLEAPSVASSFELFTKLPPIGEKSNENLPFPVAKPGVMGNRRKEQLETITEEEPFIPEHPVEVAPLSPTRVTDEKPFIPEKPVESPALTPTKLRSDRPVEKAKDDAMLTSNDTAGEKLTAKRPSRLLLTDNPRETPDQKEDQESKPRPKLRSRLLAPNKEKPSVPEPVVQLPNKKEETVKPSEQDNAFRTDEPFIPDHPTEPMALSPVQPHVTWEVKEQPKKPVQLQVEKPMEAGAFEIPLLEAPEFAHLVASPTITTERFLVTSLDRVMSSVRWTFAKELSNMIRNIRQPDISDQIEEFITEISNELMEVTETPPSIEQSLPGLCDQISKAIVNQTSPMTSALSKMESSNSSLMSKLSEEMMQLQQEADELRLMFKTNTDKIIKELEKERQHILVSKENEAQVVRDLETRMKKVQWRRVELEAQSKHQENERERLDRLSKAYLEKRETWRENKLENRYEENSRLRRRLLQEINSLKEESDRGVFETLSGMLNEGVRTITDEYHNLKEELMNLDLSNSLLMMNLRKRPAPLGKAYQAKRPSLSEDQKIGKFKRKWESTIQGIADNTG